MTRHKKAQLSLEYIGTYTLVLTMAAAFMGVAFYFDLFNTERFMNPYCVFDSNFYCHDYTIMGSGTNTFNMSILLQNDMGVIIDINQTKLTDKEQQEITCDSFQLFCRFNDTSPYAVASPSSKKINKIKDKKWTPTRLCRLSYTGCNRIVDKNSKMKVNVELNFSGQGRNYTHFSYGTVYANVQ